MFLTRFCCCFVVVLVVSGLLSQMASLAADQKFQDVNKPNGWIVYTREDLVQLSNCPSDFPGLSNVPDEIHRRIRKRGRRGGVRARCRRRGSRVPLPRFVCGNVRSLRNKIDELTALTRWNNEYRESSLICLTETWLQHDKDPDVPYEIEGFTLIRGDRTPDSGKITGGGVCLYVNKKWCKDFSIYERCCSANIEYLSVSFRPYYLPREIPKVFVTVVYIPPSANLNVAEDILHDVICRMENENPEATNIITGDFNSCHFVRHIPTYQQYVNFATRNDNLLDLFFCNVKNSYVAKRLSPLGISDHLMTQLMPIYKQKLKREKPTVIEIKDWSNDVSDTVLACMECTDFEVLFDENSNVDQNVDVFNSYLTFCTDMLIPRKVVKCFPNNKPWVTKELKALLNQKKHFLASRDREQLKLVQREINKQIIICKERYKKKVETMFKSNTKSAWNGLRQLTGMKKSKLTPDVHNAKEYCNVLNKFYARFDKYDFASCRDDLCQFHCEVDDQPIRISCNDVLSCLKNIKIDKANGPDKTSGRLLRLCCEPLSPVLCRLYQQSFNENCIPLIWKTSEIVPVPKKANPVCDNDYRPVALTSIMMKCLEKIVKRALCEQVKPYTDCHQFAYCENRCVEDATVSLTDFVLNHVDKVSTSDSMHYVKILFVDFSSAFNTIQPHILMQKLGRMNVNSRLILWINNFLANRLQYVKFMGNQSEVITTNTGAPQGCVLSPLLFTIYTSDCHCKSECCQLFKYADDTALVSKCVNNDLCYREEVSYFTEWCSQNYLELNVKKTKEMVVDFRAISVTHDPLYINGEIVENVSEYKYLGTIIDNKFNFDSNVDEIYKKMQYRVYYVRQLSKLKIDNTIMNVFYTAIVQSKINFSITSWYGNCNAKSKKKLTKIINNCIRLGVTNAMSLLDLYKKSVKQRCNVIQKDVTHPLHDEYEILPSGRRFRNKKCRTERYSRSFVPSSIRILNK